MTLAFRQKMDGMEALVEAAAAREFPEIAEFGAARQMASTRGNTASKLIRALPQKPRKTAPAVLTPEEWKAAAAGNGPDDSPSRGWLVFHNLGGPGCSRCHTIDGRGGKVGPDLSRIGASFTREKLIDSILEPSREVSPQFTTWQMVHVDGRVFTGMLVHENEGKTILGDNEGKTIELKTAEIEERRPVKTSVMPEKLVERMTVQEWRDVISFLQGCR
jgi:putative heme-binding domain-containing protein